MGRRPQVDCARTIPIRRRRRLVRQVLHVQLLGDRLEELVDTIALLRRGLHVEGVHALRVRLRLLQRHFCTVDPVSLGSGDGQHNVVVVGLLLELVGPVGETLKALLRGGVVAEGDGGRILVVDVGEGAELLAAGRVPDLQFDFYGLHDVLWRDLDDLGGVVGAEGGFCVRELALDVAVDDAGLAYARVAQHHHLVALYNTGFNH